MMMLRGMRYCEILLFYSDDEGLAAEVWGTQGLNLCPTESWDALDPVAADKLWAMSEEMTGVTFA